MIEDRNLIVFADDWGRYPSTIQHIVRVLLKKNNRVIWIGSLGHRKPKFTFADLKRVFEKLLHLFSNRGEKKKDIPIIQVTPFIIPLHDVGICRRLNRRLLVRTLKKVIEIHKFESTIVLTSTPLIADIVGKLNDTSVHYFCQDDYLHFEGAFKSLKKFEDNLLLKADTCFAVSEPLVRTRIPKNGEVHFLPQGVDTDHFSINRKKTLSELEKLNKPIIGFFGLLAEWVNIELIIKCTNHYPEYTFLIVGRTTLDLSIFNGINNLIYIGEIPYNELPSYAANFDVGLIPFRINELTIAANPLKLLEYMSLGIPVVATNLPEVVKFDDFVFVANDENEFIELIENALKDNIEERNKLRRAKAENYSWESIAEDVSKKILYPNKYGNN